MSNSKPFFIVDVAGGVKTIPWASCCRKTLVAQPAEQAARAEDFRNCRREEWFMEIMGAA